MHSVPDEGVGSVCIGNRQPNHGSCAQSRQHGLDHMAAEGRYLNMEKQSGDGELFVSIIETAPLVQERLPNVDIEFAGRGMR